ncbi:MAG: HD domain-containing protein [Spirochaetia bacterium]|nr:HD domain-containing protein [Spirochaetia bacterium]
MKKVSVQTLKAGMAFDQPVYIDADNKLVNAKEMLSQSDIDRLKNWNITEVETNGAPIMIQRENVRRLDIREKKEIDEASANIKQAILQKSVFNDLYLKAVKTLEKSYEEIGKDRPYQISIVRSIADEIADFIVRTPSFFIHMFNKTDEETDIYRHAVNSAIFSGVTAQALDYSKPKMVELIFGILMMDLGMAALPKAILQKEKVLTDEEKRKLQAHTIFGYQLLTQNVKLKNTIAIIALQHHEHFDGTGYPKKIKGDSISEYARIAAIADSFAAMLEKKTYHEPVLPYTAMKELLTLGLYRYDPVFMKALLDKMSIYPIGSLVSLSDSSIGIVAGATPKKPMRPIILLFKNAQGQSLQRGEFVHLMYHTDKYIKRAESSFDLNIIVEEELERLLTKI